MKNAPSTILKKCRRILNLKKSTSVPYDETTEKLRIEFYFLFHRWLILNQSAMDEKVDQVCYYLLLINMENKKR